MSSRPSRVRFSRPLRAVSSATASERQARPERVASVEEMQLAERRRDLDRQVLELARGQEELARREAELAETEAQLSERLERLAALISSVHKEKLEMLEANEEEIVSFSLSITQKVLQYEIENGRYKIGEVVRSALRAVRDRGPISVRVNPRDLDMARAAVEKLAKSFGTTRINTIPDESIPLASCCIETDSGKVFSEIPGRLKAIERSLLRKNGDSDGV